MGAAWGGGQPRGELPAAGSPYSHSAQQALPGGAWGGSWVTARRAVVKRTRLVTVRAVLTAVVATLAGLLATARLTRLVSADRVMLPFRRAVARRWGPSSAVAYLVNCRWCVSMYLSVPVAAAVVWLVPAYRLAWWLPTLVLGALLALAYSHGTALLAGLEDED